MRTEPPRTACDDAGDGESKKGDDNPVAAQKARTNPKTTIRVDLGDASDHYEGWPDPHCIICDGPYGVGRYPGEPRTVSALPTWYRPHLQAWNERARPGASLWVWGTELSWATLHGEIESAGWEYRGCQVWDKGVGRIAGTTNTATLRRFPPVTEVCVHYTRTPMVGEKTLKQWLRSEWSRTGLTLKSADTACGVRGAASRKYLSADHLWYAPPGDKFEALAEFANREGRAHGRPYFMSDSATPMKGSDIEKMRGHFDAPFGVTNVWRLPHVQGNERVREREAGPKEVRALHASQKPLALIDRIVRASTRVGDILWEPFGGLCPSAIIAARTGRSAYAAEINPVFYEAAVLRRMDENHGAKTGDEGCKQDEVE